MEILIHEERRHKNQHGILRALARGTHNTKRVQRYAEFMDFGKPGGQPTGLCSYALRSTAVGNAMHSNYCLLSSTINTPTHRSKSKSMLYFLAADFFFGAAFLAGDFLAAFGLEAFLAMAFLGAALALALDAFLGAMILRGGMRQGVSKVNSLWRGAPW